MKICLFEDEGVGLLAPLTLSRPAFDLLCGGASLLDHQRRCFAAPVAGALVRPAFRDLCRQTYPYMVVNDAAVLADDLTVLVNARWLPPRGRVAISATPSVALCDGQVAYVVLRPGTALYCAPETIDEWVCNWRSLLPSRATDGWMIDHPWDLIRYNGEVLSATFADQLTSERLSVDLPGCVVIGPRELLRIDPSARVEPLVVIDVTGGPVVIDRGAKVQAFSRIGGPTYIGPQCQVKGARISESTLGPLCKVGGEIESSILQGYSNKCHDGFLGHSYLGAWVNLGAGTQTSDLRNDYGTVSLTVAGEKVDSGLTKVGSFIGDHTKTGLGTLLNTGTVVGAFCNLLPGGGLLPKVIPSFCAYWQGRLRERQDLRDLPGLTATVMRRRGREPSDADRAFLRWLYLATAQQRRQVLAEAEQRAVRVGRGA
jgi:UDP-N-acetylglucosamine diphosphorylase/glucosamine-1-phosphate N-acetyltransferase